MNQVDILLAPTLSMIPLGGFLASGGVGLWGILAPLGALVFSEVRSAVRWYAAFAVVFVGSGIVGDVTGPIWSSVPRWFTSTMLALNIVVGGAIMFTLPAVFAGQRRDALAALRQEQAKAENLLLNMVAGGVPTPRPDHARALALMALDMLESIRSNDGLGHLGLDLRVGINSGPVVASVETWYLVCQRDRGRVPAADRETQQLVKDT